MKSNGDDDKENDDFAARVPAFVKESDENILNRYQSTGPKNGTLQQGLSGTPGKLRPSWLTGQKKLQVKTSQH